MAWSVSSDGQYNQAITGEMISSMIRTAIFLEVFTSPEFFNAESTKLSIETSCSTIKKIK